MPPGALSGASFALLDLHAARGLVRCICTRPGRFEPASVSRRLGLHRARPACRPGLYPGILLSLLAAFGSQNSNLCSSLLFRIKPDRHTGRGRRLRQLSTHRVEPETVTAIVSMVRSHKDIKFYF